MSEDKKDEVERYRELEASWRGEPDKEEKLAEMVKVFSKGMRTRDLDGFKRSSIVQLQGTLIALRSKHEKMCKEIDEALALFDSVYPFPRKTYQQCSDIQEDLNPAEAKNGKSNT